MSRKYSTPGYHPIKKIKVIFKGLHIAVITDFSVAYKLVLSIPIAIGAIAFHKWVDLSLILIATGLMLLGELLNSAIEILCDFVEQQQNPQIGAIKDIAAAAAGVGIFVWMAILIIEGIHLLTIV
ncbi:diacylglycerol kinase [Chamaesiphon minutus]|uniref:Diacylglycerol kinase n=1 Tax=Chamaesiphon minutus (strain ATCC 27169 / PCC 6605) TaxID=1173020 RepID=K9UF18_CHAP6|nr:diacylglycerol kinase [Chamaesiphon minutus]AFY93415.1 diacylglycerol kinase [Chamaesiphon minutus PCC 6605]